MPYFFHPSSSLAPQSVMHQHKSWCNWQAMWCVVLFVVCCSFLLRCVCKDGNRKCYHYVPSVRSGDGLGSCNVLRTNCAWKSGVREQGVSHVSLQQGSLHSILKNVLLHHSKFTSTTCDSHVSCFTEFKLNELFQVECQTMASVCATCTPITHGSCFEQSNLSLQKAVLFTFVHLEHTNETSLMKKLRVANVLMILNICNNGEWWLFSCTERCSYL